MKKSHSVKGHASPVKYCIFLNSLELSKDWSFIVIAHFQCGMLASNTNFLQCSSISSWSSVPALNYAVRTMCNNFEAALHNGGKNLKN